MEVTEHKLSIDKVADRKHTCVLIDDSGTPGQLAGSTYLDPSRKTWVAVLITPRQMREIADEISGAFKELESQTGASEFHFTEIYRGSGAFSGVSLPLRQALFSFMRRIFELYMFPVLVQTVSKHDLREIHTRAAFPKRVGVFDLHQPTDASLLFLLFHVRRFLSEHSSEYPIPAFVVLDEGFRPADRAIDIPGFQQHFHRSSIFTARSSEFSALQIADFAAFSVARIQWLLTKPKRSKVDDEFMEIMAGPHLNIVNLPQVSVDLRTWTPQDYERIIDEDRVQKGLKPRANDA